MTLQATVELNIAGCTVLAGAKIYHVGKTTPAVCSGHMKTAGAVAAFTAFFTHGCRQCFVYAMRTILHGLHLFTRVAGQTGAGAVGCVKRHAVGALRLYPRGQKQSNSEREEQSLASLSPSYSVNQLVDGLWLITCRLVFTCQFKLHWVN